MSANEISERLAAAAWVRIGPGQGGVPNDSSKLSIRSLVGFQQKLYIPTNLNSAMLTFVMLLDREMSRRETACFVTPVVTVDDQNRTDYPDLADLDVVAGTSIAPFIHPFHTDWLGKTLDTPGPFTWFPFNLGTQPNVPDGFDLDRYNAIAWVLNQATLQAATLTYAVDLSLLVLKHPPIQSTSITVIQTVPVPVG